MKADSKLKSTKLICGLLSAVVALSSCTKPGETTAIGATAGGVIGAGMGAVVGGQTGDPWTGAAVGAAAGALAGSAIGNALQAHEEVMQRQDEAMERQQRIISSQQSEIRELRRIGQDTITYKSPTDAAYKRGAEERASSKIDLVIPPSLANKKFNTQPSTGVWRQREDSNMGAVATTGMNFGSKTASDVSVGTTVKTPDLTLPKKQTPKPVVAAIKPSASNAGNIKVAEVKTTAITEENITEPLSDTAAAVNRAAETSVVSDDCKKAEQEMSQSDMQEDASDKLFHLRRALRLCPDNGAYHRKLGDLYSSLNRKDDAKYEFGEALRLNPSDTDAQKKINNLNKY